MNRKSFIASLAGIFCIPAISKSEDEPKNIIIKAKLLQKKHIHHEEFPMLVRMCKNTSYYTYEQVRLQENQPEEPFIAIDTIDNNRYYLIYQDKSKTYEFAQALMREIVSVESNNALD